jgi:hypothetical protein
VNKGSAEQTPCSGTAGKFLLRLSGWLGWYNGRMWRSAEIFGAQHDTGQMAKNSRSRRCDDISLGNWQNDSCSSTYHTMIDPGTVVGITSFGLQVCQGLLSFYQRYKEWGEDVVELCHTLQSTKSILQLLQNSLSKRQHDESIATAIMDEMQHCLETYKTMEAILSKISQGKGKEGVRQKGSAWVRAKYPLKASLVVKLRGFLHEQIQHLSILLDILHMWVGTPFLVSVV